MYPFDTPFYHTLTALSTIETRQAAFTIVPGSHTRAREWLAGLSAAELERMRDDGDFRGSQSQAFLASGAVDRAEAVEVLMDAGDTCIFELLCTHSASRNERDSPRHVIFQTFFDRAGPYSRIVNQQKPAGIWCATFPSAWAAQTLSLSPWAGYLLNLVSLRSGATTTDGFSLSLGRPSGLFLSLSWHICLSEV